MTEYNGNDEAGYLQLPGHPGKESAGCVEKTIQLCEILKEHNGPDVLLDYDKNGVLIGIVLLFE